MAEVAVILEQRGDVVMIQFSGTSSNQSQWYRLDVTIAILMEDQSVNQNCSSPSIQFKAYYYAQTEYHLGMKPGKPYICGAHCTRAQAVCMNSGLRWGKTY